MGINVPTRTGASYKYNKTEIPKNFLHKVTVHWLKYSIVQLVAIIRIRSSGSMHECNLQAYFD